MIPRLWDYRRLFRLNTRRVASHSTVWRRMLFDPVTGAIADEATRNYRPTASMRRAVEQKWRTCTAPGCTRNAERCEIDHCEPFLHEDPGQGGRTHPDNLIPLCVQHHQLKTEGVIRLRRAGPNGQGTSHGCGHAHPCAQRRHGRRDSLLTELLGVRLRSPISDDRGRCSGTVHRYRQSTTSTAARSLGGLDRPPGPGLRQCIVHRQGDHGLRHGVVSLGGLKRGRSRSAH